MLPDDAAEKIVQSLFKIPGIFKHIRILTEGFCHCRIQRNIRCGNRLHGARHAELKFIAGKRHGRGAVAVSGIFWKFRKDMNADFEFLMIDTTV